MKKYYVFISAVFLTTLLSCKVQAQHYSTKNKKAIKFFELALDDYNKYDDKSVVKNCDLAIKADPKFGEPYLLKGTLYFEKKEYDLAEENLMKAVEIDPKEFSPAYAALGDLYNARFDFGKAYRAYLDYMKYAKLKEDKELIYQRKAYAAYIADSLVTHPVPFDPHNMGPEINSELSEYHPSLPADGSFIIYTVVKKDGNPACPGMMSNEGEEDFYYSIMDKNGWKARVNAGSPLNSPCHEGAANLSPDGRFIFFYSARDRNDFYKRDSPRDIYYAEKEGNNWGTPVALPYPVNTPSFESQPTFSSDGKTLYFTSDRPGGMGGNDIWKTVRGEDGAWSNPENMGPEINTNGNEISPFIHPDNQTLYFASDGRFGVGGYDFYYARKNENGEFADAKNLGYPINTPYDERSLVISADGSRGYFASKNLEGYGQYDLYYFDLYKDAQPVFTTYLKGHIYDAQTKKSMQANFELIDVESGTVIVTSLSDKVNGEFLISLPKNKQYALNVSAEGYLFHSETFNMVVENNSEPYLIDIGLNKVSENIPIVLKNVFFDTDKSDLKDESTVELNKLVEFLNNNPKLKIEISGHTDNVGSKSHNLQLSENRAKAVYNFLIGKGINATRLTYKGYGDTQPIADNNTDEGRAHNRRTEFKVTGK